jgi:hypothetical protein
MASGASYYNSIITNTYTHLWNKYRPVILKMMVDAASEPQQYSLSSHEFKGINPKEKGGYTFTLQAYQGKAKNKIKTSEVAQGLLGILQQSPKAAELLNKESYEFVMDKHFKLYVRKEEVVIPQEVITSESSQ